MQSIPGSLHIGDRYERDSGVPVGGFSNVDFVFALI